MKNEVEITLQIKGIKTKYGVRGEPRFLKGLLLSIENTAKLLLKKNKTLADKKQIKVLSN